MSEAAVQLDLLAGVEVVAPAEPESGVMPVAEVDDSFDLEAELEAEADALAARGALVAGWFPDLPPGPRPTPGYRPPPKRLPPDADPDEDLVAEQARSSAPLFGFLRVKSVLATYAWGKTYLCVCERPGADGAPCGNEKPAPASKLRDGVLRSCGCGSNYRSRRP